MSKIKQSMAPVPGTYLGLPQYPESEFFVTIVNRGVLRTFTNTVKFKFQVLFNKLRKVSRTDHVHVSTNVVRCLQRILNLRTFASGRFLYMCEYHISFVNFLRRFVRTFVRVKETFSCIWRGLKVEIR